MHTISQRLGAQQPCACESPVCSLIHAPAIAPLGRGLHRAVVARLVRVSHTARRGSRATGGALATLPRRALGGRAIGVRRLDGAREPSPGLR